MNDIPHLKAKAIFRASKFRALVLGIVSIILMWTGYPPIAKAVGLINLHPANQDLPSLSAPLTPTPQFSQLARPSGSSRLYLPFVSKNYYAVSTYYIDGARGNDANNGSQSAPWKTIPHAVNTIRPGDTVIIRAGIYQASYIFFGPAGIAPANGTGALLTIFKSAPNERVLFTDPFYNPPSIQMADYVRLDGFWFGGNRNTALRQQGLSPGGSPIGNGKEIVNNTFFNFNEGMSGGSTQYTLIQSNRFVNTGQYATQQHGIYITGDDQLGTGGASTHVIIDNNILIGGEGYGIQGWHTVHDMILTRNIITNHNWGVVVDGSDHLIANNFFWKVKGDPGTLPWGENLAGTRTLTYNNIFGQNAWIATNSIAVAPASQNAIENNAFNTLNMPTYWPVEPQGLNQVILVSGQEAAQMGISAQAFDSAVAALKNSFVQSVQSIYQDQSIESNFAIIRSAVVPTTSPLYHTGKRWSDSSTPMNIGPNTPVPPTSDGFWAAFRSLGLTEYDRYGNVISPR